MAEYGNATSSIQLLPVPPIPGLVPFSSFRRSSNPSEPDKTGNTSPISTGSSMYRTNPNQDQRASQIVGPIGVQRRPDAGGRDEHGRSNSIRLTKELPQAPTQGTGSTSHSNLVGSRVQAVQAGSYSTSNPGSSTGGSSMSRRGSSSGGALVTRDIKGEIHPEIQQVVDLTLAHSSKIYCSGPLVRRIEKRPDGTIVSDAKWEEVWAQLGGSTLSVWDMEAVMKAYAEGREVPPTYVNVTDSHVQVLGSIITAATVTSPAQEYTNVVTINTAGSNLILFACPSPQNLLSWATAFRLAAWEKSRLEEIYTGHLLRLCMMDGGRFVEPESTLDNGKLEGWAKVRITGGTEWQRLWIVISGHAVSGRIDAGLSGPPNDSVIWNRLPSFLGGKSTPSSGDHASSSSYAAPMIAMYLSNKTKDKKRALYTAARVTQAFAVYPERPEIINQAALFKIEAIFKDEQVYAMTQPREGPVEARERYMLLIPEVDSGKVGSREMVKWLIAVHDAFQLYGRPEGYTWDPRNPRSMFFTYPYGPHSDHLFLDRELAEVLDPRVHETSRVRGALINVLVQRMNALPQAQQDQIQQQEANGGPHLPPLDFIWEGGQDHSSRNVLTAIREQSILSSNSRPGVMQNQQGDMQQFTNFQSKAKQSADSSRNGTSNYRAIPSASPVPSSSYTLLTSAVSDSPPLEGNGNSVQSAASTPPLSSAAAHQSNSNNKTNHFDGMASFSTPVSLSAAPYSMPIPSFPRAEHSFAQNSMPHPYTMDAPPSPNAAPRPRGPRIPSASSLQPQQSPDSASQGSSPGPLNSFSPPTNTSPSSQDHDTPIESSSSVWTSQDYLIASLEPKAPRLSTDESAATESSDGVENPVDGVPQTDDEDVTPTLAQLMVTHRPHDLTGHVTIPDYQQQVHGGNAVVYTGLLNGTPVAVKVLKVRKNRKADAHLHVSNERRIMREINVWAALKHRNVCEFLGYVTEFSDYPGMVSTWHSRGTASDYMESQNLTVSERLRLAQDVSEGLGYLHHLKIIHGDLKPCNVLIDDACVARLCDFGLVRIDWEGGSGMTTTSPYTGTLRYKAPELFYSADNRRPVATFHGDIYSLGCLLLEFVETIYPFRRFKTMATVGDAINDKLPPALRSEAINALSDNSSLFWDLLEACWDEPSGRPSIRIVVQALGHFAQGISAS